jgi:hypothetical protein
LGISKTEKLKKLEEQAEQLKARIASEKAKITNQARKDDTRRKILVGAYFIEQAEHEGTMEELIKKIDPFLTREKDRLLFGLSAKPGSKTSKPKPPASKNIQDQKAAR